MFLITCPHCGEARAEEEFHRAGEAHLMRPADPDACSDAEWGDYLYFRDNPRGVYREMWVHASGCRKHFNLARDTATYEILGAYPIGGTFELPRTPRHGGEGGAGWQEVGASVPSNETPPTGAGARS